MERPLHTQASWQKQTGEEDKRFVVMQFRFFVVCFDLGFHTRNPVIKYWPDASCMSYMEARAEMP